MNREFSVVELFIKIEERKEKIYDFFAEGAKRRDIIEDYHVAKLPRFAFLFYDIIVLN
jgi:hypothetical protein